MNIDLTQYVIAKWGPWLEDREAFSAGELRLGSLLDGVTLAGPLRVRVSVQARNELGLLGTAALAVQARDVYSYTLDIPPGQTWTYPAARALEREPDRPAAPARPSPPRDASGAVLDGVVLPADDHAVNERILQSVATALLRREALWGANAGFGIAIRHAGHDLCADPCAPDPCRPVDPCAPPKKKECHCGGGCGGGCRCEEHGDDLPCDFATGSGAHLGRFFPAACEPCAPGAFIGMPPMKGPSLVVPAARGGTVRTRYFNGMFITKEDLWTDQNNNRIKHALMNRAMGQGVVWGFDVCLDGEAVCVLPGYGVDCCGNDIVISSAYRVAAEALVRDPAAAAVLAKGRAHRMNLLLEYFECPEEPRPVHGDPCAPDSIACEMSRIRETARLRLIPPCEVDDSGPIKDFLDELRKLKGDPMVGPLLQPPAIVPVPQPPPGLVPGPGPVPTPTPVPVPANEVPFGMRFKSPSGNRFVQPLPGSSVTDAIAAIPSAPISIALQFTTANAFLDGSVRLQSGLPGSPKTILPTLTAAQDWQTTVPAPGTVVYLVDAFRARLPDGSEYTGSIFIELSRSGDLPVVAITVRTGRVFVTRPGRPQEPAPVPSPPPVSCWSEACDPEGRPRFPIPLPWLHEDPRQPGVAADPKVLVLAILYAVVVAKITESGAAVTPEIAEQQQKLADALNLTAWRMFYETMPDVQRADLTEGLRRLFQGWCKSLLYPGPRCECGCDPHGVVIGCALVEGGRIRMADPWGGRRWVVHYPLLAYWGKLFGIQPLDALASKFFDLICCIAHQYPAQHGAQPGEHMMGGALGLDMREEPVIPLGAGVLMFGRSPAVDAHVAGLGVAPDRTVTISAVEFVSKVVEALGLRGALPAPGATMTVYRVAGLPELTLVAPSAPVAGAAAHGGALPRGGPLAHVADTVRDLVASRPARSAIPLLLREFTEELAQRLLEAVPMDGTTPAGRAVRDVLVRANVRTVAELLESSPEHVHVDLLNRANAIGVAELFDQAEKVVPKVTRAVGDVVRQFASEAGLFSRDQLRDAALMAQFQRALVEALGEVLPEDQVEAAIRKTVEGAG